MNGRFEQQRIPYWEKYTLTISQAAEYFGIGETRLREYINENPTARYLLKNGNKTLIKRQMFEKVIDEIYVI